MTWLIWMTGLSGSGKSTLAEALEARLKAKGRRVFQLDGDRLRTGLCADLGYSEQDRRENLRRAGEAARLLVASGCDVIASFISPYRFDRDRIRGLFPKDRFAEVHVAASLEACESRDPKGLYAKARRGEIPDFTGVHAPYEPPPSPELLLDTAILDIPTCLERLEALVARLERP